jgi:hypothetical protein
LLSTHFVFLLKKSFKIRQQVVTHSPKPLRTGALAAGLLTLRATSFPLGFPGKETPSILIPRAAGPARESLWGMPVVRTRFFSTAGGGQGSASYCVELRRLHCFQ